MLWNQVNFDQDEDEDYTEYVGSTICQLRRLEGNLAAFRPTSPKEAKKIINKIKIRRTPGRNGTINDAKKFKKIVAIMRLLNAIMILTHLN